MAVPGVRVNKTQTIRDIIKEKVSISRAALFDELAQRLGLPLARVKLLTAPLLWQLMTRGEVLKDDNDVLTMQGGMPPHERSGWQPPAEVFDSDEAPTVTRTRRRTVRGRAIPSNITDASLKRIERSAEIAQGLDYGDRRLRICDSAACAGPKDVRIGTFQMPAGTHCGRCGARIDKGVIVVERMK